MQLQRLLENVGRGAGTIEDGKVTKLRGEPGHPVKPGWICERCKAFVEHLNHEDRLNYPLKKYV